jgi:hypothetical protein
VIFELFKRSLKEHLGFHLLIPVVLVFAFSAWSETTLRDGGFAAWEAFIRHWPASHAKQLAEIYLAFFLVVAWSIKRAGDVQSTRVESLRDILPTTTRYFGLGVIPLHEWFEPTTAVYLATIIQHQLANPGFSHERTLLFTRERDIKAVSVSYLDEPHAKALAAIHRQFGIPLTYLPPDEYAQLMRDLPETHRRVLGCERRYISWLRAWIPRLPFAWTLRPLAPLVLLEQIDGSHMVITFDKHGRTLTLSPVGEPSLVEASKALVDRISGLVYRTGTRTPLERYTFGNVLEL